MTTLPEALAALDAHRGCGDRSCRFARIKGMATNGGCRCFDDGIANPDARESDRETRRLLAEVVKAARESVRERLPHMDREDELRAAYNAGEVGEPWAEFLASWTPTATAEGKRKP